jgi:hypothetical protein
MKVLLGRMEDKKKWDHVKMLFLSYLHIVIIFKLDLSMQI